MRTLFILYVLAGLSSCQQLIPLNSLSDKQWLRNLPVGALLYLSSNDDPDVLKQITLTIGNSPPVNVLEMSTSYIQKTTGLKLSYPIIGYGEMNVTTTNTDDDMKKLKGCIYIDTKRQADSGLLSVYDVISRAQIGLTAGTSLTLVFLNPPLIRDRNTPEQAPERSAMITSLQQHSDGEKHIDIFVGMPQDVTPDTQIRMFTNKVALNETYSQYFDKIDPMQITSPVFFMNVVGGLDAVIEQMWVDQSTISTTSETTTGLIMSESTFLKQTINFQRNDGYNRTTGFIYSLYVNSNINITMDGDSAINLFQTGTDPAVNQKYLTDLIANSLTVTSSANGNIGHYYIQYIGVEGPWNGITKAPPVTTVTPGPSTMSSAAVTRIPVQSTTNNASSIHSFLSVVFAIIYLTIA